MAKVYYTLAVREDGVWSPQFGDYSRATVFEERDSVLDSTSVLVKRKDTKIVQSGDTQAEINAAIAKLNK